MILVLTEAGSDVGYGHLSRCLAVVENLPYESELLIHPDSGFSQENVKVFPWRSDISGVINYIDERGVDMLLIDSYLADLSVYEAFKDAVGYVVVFDDFDRITYPVNLVINPSILGPQYLAQVSEVVSGSDWVILRREILKHEKKLKHSDLKHVVLSFGGTDKARLFERLLPLMLGLDFYLSVVAGSDAKARELESCFVDSRLHVYGRLEAENLADLFVSADLAISAGGQTLNELAYLGVPFLAIESGVDQYWNISAYVSHNVTPEHLKADDPHLEQKLQDALESLKDSTIRSSMAERSMELIDGGGAARIAEIIAQKGRSGVSASRSKVL